jgi:uncharacterized protein (DUF433 family)
MPSLNVRGLFGALLQKMTWRAWYNDRCQGLFTAARTGVEMDPTTHDLIQKTPGVIGGDACIGKRRIAVWMLVRARQHGVTDDQLRSDYQPPLTQAELDAAWLYYETHRDEIENAIRQNEEAD